MMNLRVVIIIMLVWNSKMNKILRIVSYLLAPFVFLGLVVEFIYLVLLEIKIKNITALVDDIYNLLLKIKG